MYSTISSCNPTSHHDLHERVITFYINNSASLLDFSLRNPLTLILPRCHTPNNTCKRKGKH